MAKRRMIHDCIWSSEDVAELTMRQRLLWVGLITTADDQGRGRAHPGLVRASVFPFDVITQDEIGEDLAAIEVAGMVLLYEVDGSDYYQITNWWEYQSPQWATPSDYPAPNDWDDRLRYRSRGQYIALNWPGTEDRLPDSGDDSGECSGEPSGEDFGLSDSDSDSDSDRKKKSTSAKSVYQEIRDVWSTTFPSKAQPRPDTQSYISKVRTRIRSTHFRENWKTALERASRSHKLHEAGWFDLGWFLKNDVNYEKCLNGNYDDWGNQQTRLPGDPAPSVPRKMRTTRAGGDA